VVLLPGLVTAAGLPGYALFYMAVIGYYFFKTIDPSFITRFAEIAISFGQNAG